MPIVETPLGQLSYQLDGSGALSKMWFGTHDFAGGASVALEEQIREFFARERRVFDIPLGLRGTEFQLAVWHELLRIPCGETRSYQQIANALGLPKATRAVGAANGANPIALVVPCHRVIGSNGKLTGYAAGLEMKSKLLEFERRSLFDE